MWSGEQAPRALYILGSISMVRQHLTDGPLGMAIADRLMVWLTSDYILTLALTGYVI